MFLILSPAILAIPTLYLLAYWPWGLAYPLACISLAIYFNEARKTRFNTGKPEIDDRDYWREVNGKRLD